MLANSLTWSGVHLVLEQWFRQTLCVRYFTGIILSSIGDVPVNKIRHYALAILLGLLSYHYV